MRCVRSGTSTSQSTTQRPARFRCPAHRAHINSHSTRKRHGAVTRAASGSDGGQAPKEFSLSTVLATIRAAPGAVVTAVKAFPGTVATVATAAGATGAALIVAASPDVPEWARREHLQVASTRSEEVFSTVFSGGDRERWQREVSFYIDGFARLGRDFGRHGSLIIADPAGLDDRSRARRDAALADLRALLPFLFLVMNTFPLTPIFVGPLIDRLPRARSLWLPSQFDQRRLAAVRRLRVLKSRGPGT